jgi:hypothetical protein
MLRRKITDVYSVNHIKPTDVCCEQNLDILNVKKGDTHSNHCDLMV